MKVTFRMLAAVIGVSLLAASITVRADGPKTETVTFPNGKDTHQRFSGHARKARTLSGAHRGSRMVGPQRLGEGADGKARVARIRRARRGPLSRQSRCRCRRGARVEPRAAPMIAPLST